MNINGLHIMLTWQCLLECDHCFVWSSPRQQATWSLEGLQRILNQARALGSIKWIYFEGGEPFLYYPTLLSAVQAAAERGFQVGVVTNAYWATTLEDARAWLQPFAGLVEDLSISSDRYHWNKTLSHQAQVASQAAGQLGIPHGLLQVAMPPELDSQPEPGEPAPEGSTLMFRGRAAANLAGRVHHQPWTTFTNCPYEELDDPGRLHLDPYGNLHVCQGISLGNALANPIGKILAAYQPEAHPITGPLLRGGPVELVRQYDLAHEAAYADACHLCYAARLSLRERFVDILGPVEMYGLPSQALD